MTNDDILPLKEIQKYLVDKRLYVIAKRVKLSYPTLKKLANGLDYNYTVDTLKAISKYIIESRGGKVDYL